MATETIDKTDTTTDTRLGKPHNVILFNDESHNMDEVRAQIVKATKCSSTRAFQIMMEAHESGRAICFTGTKERCELVEEVLGEIQLQTKIEQV